MPFVAGTEFSYETPPRLFTVPFNVMGAIVIVSVASLVEYELAIYLWKVGGRRGRRAGVRGGHLPMTES